MDECSRSVLLSNVPGEWIIDYPTGRIMKVTTEALRSGKIFDEKDFINILTFREFQQIKDIANKSCFKFENDEMLTEALKEKDKIIESQFKTIERLLDVIEKVTTPIITIQEPKYPNGVKCEP